MPGAHKIGAAISGPRIAGGNFMGTPLFLIDDDQITHLICVRLKFLLYDFGGVFWASFLLFLLYKWPKKNEAKSQKIGC